MTALGGTSRLSLWRKPANDGTEHLMSKRQRLGGLSLCRFPWLAWIAIFPGILGQDRGTAKEGLERTLHRHTRLPKLHQVMSLAEWPVSRSKILAASRSQART